MSTALLVPPRAPRDSKAWLVSPALIFILALFIGPRFSLRSQPQGFSCAEQSPYSYAQMSRISFRSCPSRVLSCE